MNNNNDDDSVDDETINDKVQQEKWYYKEKIYVGLGQQIFKKKLRSSWFCY